MIGMRKRGGEMAGKGNYWNFSTGERIHIEDKGVLPGDRSQAYYSARPAVVLLAGPVLGLAYAAFLPFIGIAMLVSLISRKALGGVFGGAWKGASFSWKPSEAYLAGKKRKTRKTDEEKRTDEEKKQE